MERSLICGYFHSNENDQKILVVMQEMQSLAETAGAQVIGLIPQKRAAPDRRYLIGPGKAEEIRTILKEKGGDLLILYNELTSSQQRNLEDLTGVKVIDRTRLILDIFAQHAQSMEGKLQVELAQYLYLLPRLTGKGVELSRLGGGIGTRGPGETKLEADRRRIKKRISLIRHRLEEVIRSRDIQRKKRIHLPVPLVSLVGYTSAGKSTLFHALTDEEVFISPKLFSTLDPLLRRADLKEIEAGYYCLLSDTVGFIRSMPKELFQSFQATLEQLHEADLILHVVDISNPDAYAQQREVEKILESMNIPSSRVIPIFNKIDRRMEVPSGSATNNSLFISAKEKTGLIDVKKEIFRRFFQDYISATLNIPYADFNIDSLSRWAIIREKTPMNGFIRVEVLSPREKVIQFQQKYGGRDR